MNLYSRAVELNRNDAESIVGLATAQLDTGDAQGAEETLKRGIGRVPRAAVLYQAYGNLLLSGIGSHDAGNDASNEPRAAELYQKAIVLDGSLPEAHYGLGKLALREDRIREARQELEAAVRLDSASSKNHYALAQVYRKLGRTADAAREVAQFQALKAKEERAFAGVAAAQGPGQAPNSETKSPAPK